MKSDVPIMHAGQHGFHLGLVRRVIDRAAVDRRAGQHYAGARRAIEQRQGESWALALFTQYRFKETGLAFTKTPVDQSCEGRTNSLGRTLGQLVSPDFSKSTPPQIVSTLEQLWNDNDHDQDGYYLDRVHQNHAA